MERDTHTDEQIVEILQMQRVAVVGISRHPEKAAHFVPKYLSENGFHIIPINPNADTILGRKCHQRISGVTEPIDIVDVFRPSEQVLSVVRDALKAKPKAIWLQEGIHSPKAEELARSRGIKVVFNRCMLAEHQRLCN